MTRTTPFAYRGHLTTTFAFWTFYVPNDRPRYGVTCWALARPDVSSVTGKVFTRTTLARTWAIMLRIFRRLTENLTRSSTMGDRTRPWRCRWVCRRLRCNLCDRGVLTFGRLFIVNWPTLVVVLVRVVDVRRPLCKWRHYTAAYGTKVPACEVGSCPKMTIWLTT